MKCEKLATRADGYQFPCGQCASCRINRKREWQARLLLESAVSKFSAFVTLTLGVPGERNDSYVTYLDKRVVQLFLKRLRKSLPKGSVRYLVVGEYGEQKGRAHYHVLLFSSVFISQDMVDKAWGLGSTHLGDVQQESIDYCLAYCLKASGGYAGLPAWDIERRSRHPEFRLFSQGLGRGAIAHLCVPDPSSGELFLQREFRVLGRSWPIGRYFRNRYRGGSATASYLSGQGDSVAPSKASEIERMLFDELRSLPVGSQAFADAREKIQEARAAQLKRSRDKAIRDYYRNLHGHIRRRHETF